MLVLAGLAREIHACRRSQCSKQCSRVKDLRWRWFGSGSICLQRRLHGVLSPFFALLREGGLVVSAAYCVEKHTFSLARARLTPCESNCKTSNAPRDLAHTAPLFLYRIARMVCSAVPETIHQSSDCVIVLRVFDVFQLHCVLFLDVLVSTQQGLSTSQVSRSKLRHSDSYCMHLGLLVNCYWRCALLTSDDTIPCGAATGDKRGPQWCCHLALESKNWHIPTQPFCVDSLLTCQKKVLELLALVSPRCLSLRAC